MFYIGFTKSINPKTKDANKEKKVQITLQGSWEKIVMETWVQKYLQKRVLQCCHCSFLKNKLITGM